MKSELLSLDELADRIGFSVNSLRLLADLGEVPCVKFSDTQYLFETGDVRYALERLPCLAPSWEVGPRQGKVLLFEEVFGELLPSNIHTSNGCLGIGPPIQMERYQ